MFTLQFYPGEGGADAAAFARELADATAKYAKAPVQELTGGAVAVHCL